MLQLEPDTWERIITALTSAGGGALFLRVVDRALARRARVSSKDAELQFRDELRMEISDLRARIKELEEEVEEWRGKYWQQQHAMTNLHSENEHLKLQLVDMNRQLAEMRRGLGLDPKPPEPESV